MRTVGIPLPPKSETLAKARAEVEDMFATYLEEAGLEETKPTRAERSGRKVHTMPPAPRVVVNRHVPGTIALGMLNGGTKDDAGWFARRWQQ